MPGRGVSMVRINRRIRGRKVCKADYWPAHLQDPERTLPDHPSVFQLEGPQVWWALRHCSSHIRSSKVEAKNQPEQEATKCPGRKQIIVSVKNDVHIDAYESPYT